MSFLSLFLLFFGRGSAANPAFRGSSPSVNRDFTQSIDWEGNSKPASFIPMVERRLDGPARSSPQPPLSGGGPQGQA
jgi:hypothetical protein